MMRCWHAALCFLFAIAFYAPPAARAQTARQQLLERVFGQLAALNPATVAAVKALPAGERLRIDTDADGQPDEVWFIDIDPRHSAQYRPLLVRAIDEDGDMSAAGEPDLDSDLYMADWGADGLVDVAIDYEDRDGDQDLDFMTMFYYRTDVGLALWWSRDDGDDNLLWHDVGYNYVQALCQVQTHFGGDESFCMFSMNLAANHFRSYSENPFLFWDLDGDGVTEEVIRVTATEDRMETVRWSFDADGDATVDQPRDFDVSISALAPAGLKLSADLATSLTVRGFRASPMLDRDGARAWLAGVTWGKTLLTWVENDVNVNGNSRTDTMARWEGVIMHSNSQMGSIGGPSCGPFNNRNEMDLDPAAPWQAYFNPVDGMVHLKGSDDAWLTVDWNGDLTADMKYRWCDTPTTPSTGGPAIVDGYLDWVELDLDMDGTPDDAWPLDTSESREFAWTWDSLRGLVLSDQQVRGERLYLLSVSLGLLVERLEPGAAADPVWTLLEGGFRNASIVEEKRQRLLASPAAIAYYLRLVCDRRAYRIKQLLGAGDPLVATIDEGRATGRLWMAPLTIATRWGIPASPAEPYAAFVARLRAEPPASRVAWTSTWRSGRIGWESERLGWWMERGRFSFLGKRTAGLVYPTIAPGAEFGTDSGGWGMEALDPGTGAGIGGLTLFVNGADYPLFGDALNWQHRLVELTQERVTVESTIAGVGPAAAPYSVRLRMTAYAGRADTGIEAFVDGGAEGDVAAWAIELPRLAQEELRLDPRLGVATTWGHDDPAAGWIGLGIIVPKSAAWWLDYRPHRRSVVLAARPGETARWHLAADWLRGHRFDRSPSARDWFEAVVAMSEAAGLDRRNSARNWTIME